MQLNYSVINPAYTCLEQLEQMAAKMAEEVASVNVTKENYEDVQAVKQDIRLINRSIEFIVNALQHCEAVALNGRNDNRSQNRYLTALNKAANAYIRDLGGDPNLLTYMIKDYAN